MGYFIFIDIVPKESEIPFYFINQHLCRNVCIIARLYNVCCYFGLNGVIHLEHSLLS